MVAGKERVLFRLNERWALSFDHHQWILKRTDGNRSSKTRWESVSFIASTKIVLYRVLREKGIKPTSQAQSALDALPATFLDFRSLADAAATPERGTAERDLRHSATRVPQTATSR